MQSVETLVVASGAGVDKGSQEMEQHAKVMAMCMMVRALQIMLYFLPKMLCFNSHILTNYSPKVCLLCLKSFT